MDKRPINRKRKSTDTDEKICRYGSLCYRKNPAHRKKFHSSAISEQIQDKVSKPASSSDLDEKKLTTLSENLTQPSEEELEDRSVITKPKFTETVGDVLKGMPEDFFEFWKFCSLINKSNPERAFEQIGLHLVGVYDLLARNIPKDKEVELYTHWRYYYDPPEFQTVIKSDDKDLYHIGYFRDDPSEYPAILASNSAKTGPNLSLKGDNIFAAMNMELTEKMKKNSKLPSKFAKIQEKLQNHAKEKKYSLDIQSSKTKARNKKVVTKTFHGLGIVVPVKNDVGYRPLPDSNAKLKSILKRIVDAKTKEEKLKRAEDLDEIINNVHFANDECDFGMGLELGIDLFCNGDSYFHPQILNLLSIAYDLLKRPKYKEIIKCHLAQRSNSKDLDTLKIN